jgi:hypothetical protein
MLRRRGPHLEESVLESNKLKGNKLILTKVETKLRALLPATAGTVPIYHYVIVSNISAYQLRMREENRCLPERRRGLAKSWRMSTAVRKNQTVVGNINHVLADLLLSGSSKFNFHVTASCKSFIQKWVCHHLVCRLCSQRYVLLISVKLGVPAVSSR